jgi:hypothetical protein
LSVSFESYPPLHRLRNEFGDDFDRLVAGAVGGVEGAEEERFAGDEDGRTFERGIADDGIACAGGEAGFFLCDGGLVDVGAEPYQSQSIRRWKQ